MTLTKLTALLIIATICGMLAGAHGALWLSGRVSVASGQIPEPNGFLHTTDGTWRYWETEPKTGIVGRCWLGPSGAWHDPTGAKLPPAGEVPE